MEDFLYSLTSGEWAGQLNAKSGNRLDYQPCLFVYTQKRGLFTGILCFTYTSCTDCCNGYSCYRQQCCHGVLTCRCIRTCSFQKRTRRPKGYSICVYVGAFDEVLGKYCRSFKMTRVKSVDFGALFELSFSVELKDKNSIKEFLDDLRALNGNLKLMLSVEQSVKSFHFQ